MLRCRHYGPPVPTAATSGKPLPAWPPPSRARQRRAKTRSSSAVGPRKYCPGTDWKTWPSTSESIGAALVHPEACVLLMRSHKGFRQAQVRSRLITGCKTQPSPADNISRPLNPHAVWPVSLVGMHAVFSTRAGPLEGNLGFAVPTARASLLLDAGALLRPSAARLTVLTPGCGRA